MRCDARGSGIKYYRAIGEWKNGRYSFFRRGSPATAGTARSNTGRLPIMIKAGVPLVAAMLVASGCGVKEGRAKKAGQAVGETFTDFASGVGTGYDKRMVVAVELTENVTGLGLSKTVSKNTGIDGKQKGISIYFVSQHAVTAALVAKALDAEDQEIGRSIVEVDFAADDAKYVTFQFDAEMDRQLVSKYLIDARPIRANHAQPQGSAEAKAEQDD